MFIGLLRHKIRFEKEPIKKYGSYFLSRDWSSSKWRPVLKAWEQLQDKTQRSDAKLLQMKTLSYSYVKYSPRVPLILLAVEEIKCKNFDFVLLLLLLSFFSLTHNSNCTLYTICTPNNSSKTVSYGPKHASLCLSYLPFCAYLQAQLKN